MTVERRASPPGHDALDGRNSSDYSSARAILSARSNSSTLERAKDPTNRVSCTLRRLTRLSHRIQLSCFKPSSTPTETWVENPCPRVSIGAQTTVGNLESIRTWRLTTTKLRKSLGSSSG